MGRLAFNYWTCGQEIRNGQPNKITILNGWAIIWKMSWWWGVNKRNLIPVWNGIANKARSTYMLPKSYIKFKIAFNLNNRHFVPIISARTTVKWIRWFSKVTSKFNWVSLLHVWLNQLNHTHLALVSGKRLGNYRQFVFLLLGTAAAVPLKWLGQEEEFTQWPLCLQLKHLSAGWGWRPRKDCVQKNGWLGENELPVDKPEDGCSLVLGWVVVELDRLDPFLRFFSRILTSTLLSADRSFFSSSGWSANSLDSYSSTAVQ